MLRYFLGGLLLLSCGLLMAQSGVTVRVDKFGKYLEIYGTNVYAKPFLLEVVHGYTSQHIAGPFTISPFCDDCRIGKVKTDKISEAVNVDLLITPAPVSDKEIRQLEASYNDGDCSLAVAKQYIEAVAQRYSIDEISSVKEKLQKGVVDSVTVWLCSTGILGSSEYAFEFLDQSYHQVINKVDQPSQLSSLYVRLVFFYQVNNLQEARRYLKSKSIEDIELAITGAVAMDGDYYKKCRCITDAEIESYINRLFDHYLIPMDIQLGADSYLPLAMLHTERPNLLAKAIDYVDGLSLPTISPATVFHLLDIKAIAQHRLGHIDAAMVTHKQANIYAKSKGLNSTSKYDLFKQMSLLETLPY